MKSGAITALLTLLFVGAVIYLAVASNDLEARANDARRAIDSLGVAHAERAIYFALKIDSLAVIQKADSARYEKTKKDLKHEIKRLQNSHFRLLRRVDTIGALPDL